MIKSSRTSSQRDPELEPLIAAFRSFRSTLFAGGLEFFVRTNLTIPQCRALYAIDQAGKLSGRQLARELGVSPAAVVPLCDRLERDGYVRRVPDTVDRRVTWLELTATGDGLLDEIATIGPSRLGPALARLSKTDREVLVRVLEELARDLGGEAQDQSPDPPRA